MATGQLAAVLQQLHQLGSVPNAGEPTDTHLLESFAARHEEAAFTALLRRYGPMVLGVCRRMLQNDADAEDAFQATFLILVRKAASISRRESLGCWLHRVAQRTALRIRAQRDLCRRLERQCPPMPQTDFIAAVVWRDLQPVLDEEVGRLPERYRLPFVLCYLEGKTYATAARLLHCPVGTLSRRLARARELLRRRLTGRGLTLPAGVLAATLSASVAPAAVPTPLTATAVRAALRNATGTLDLALTVGPRVAALVRGETQTMKPSAWTISLALLLILGLVAAGLGLLSPTAPAGPAAGKGRTQTPAVAKAVPVTLKKTRSEKTITVRGRVLTPDGKAAAGAEIALLTFPKKPKLNPLALRDEAKMRFELLGQARTDARGNFRLRVPRSPSVGEWPVLPGQLIARGKGYGFGLHGIHLDADQKGVVVRLTRERVLRGRLIDLQGEPVKGLKLLCLGVMEKKKSGLVGVLRPATPLAWWPGPLKTDARGRFAVGGVGPRQRVFLVIRDDRFVPETLELGPGRGHPKELRRTLAPAKLIAGRITYADTGKPAAGSQVRVGRLQARTDRDGRYRLNPPEFGTGQNLLALPVAGEPYLPVRKDLPPAKGAARRRFDVALLRGLLVRGRVTEAGSGKPLSGAAVFYVQQEEDNPHFKLELSLGAGYFERFPVRTDAKGNFRIAVPPGPGHLLAKAAAPEYVPVVIGNEVLRANQPGGRRWYAHAAARVNFKSKSGPHRVNFQFRPGTVVTGRVVGPDGKPAPGVRMLTRLNTSARMPNEYEPRLVTLPGSHFTLKGCDPDQAYSVVFFDEEKRWGTVVHVSGKLKGKPLTVKLQRCGSARARFLDAKGKPRVGYFPGVDLVLSPGLYLYEFAKIRKQKVLAADEVALDNIHQRYFQWQKGRTDARGRCMFPMLIPGVTYRFFGERYGPKVSYRDVAVKVGEKKDLGDIAQK
jgi:RNA polymerase sigma factor (sigma-70 family)